MEPAPHACVVSLRRQVAASLNYQMSGIPYWSEDIGGFFRPHDQYTSGDYRHLLMRWFQFGAFTPIYRVHGGGPLPPPAQDPDLPPGIQ